MIQSLPHKKEPAAEWVETKALKPWARNPRLNDANLQRVVESIKRFGFGTPILARREDSEVIAGHTRLQAALQLEIERVPVRYLDLSAEEAHILALADNRLNELGAWDDEQLLALLGDLRQQDGDAALVAGWSDVEIDRLLKAAEPPEFKEYNESIEAEVKTVSCPHCGGRVPV